MKALLVKGAAAGIGCSHFVTHLLQAVGRGSSHILYCTADGSISAFCSMSPLALICSIKMLL